MGAKTILSSAALLLASCSLAKAQDSHILSPLRGKQDNELISQLQARNPGSLCTLGVDGLGRLMSYGQEAVVDIDGTPAVLSYHPASGGHEASFTGKAIRISGPLVRQEVKGIGNAISRAVSVDVVEGGHTERLDGKWTCQERLYNIRVVN